MKRAMSEKKVAFLGLGKMGGILLQALLKKNLLSPKNTVATVRHPERAQKLSQELGISVTTDNRQAAQQSDLVLLCVKPQTVREVTEEIAAEMTSKKLLISIAASVPTHYIEEILDSEVPVVRAMPNTPCVIGCGMTGLCKGKFADESHLDIAQTLFDSVGRTVTVDEKRMDAVTGLSASGPAFIYIILESLAEGGVKVGLPRDVATLLAAQTVQGAARMVLETGQHPALLKDAVTTPAGCTVDGIMELEEGKLRVTLIKAVVKATERAKELLVAE
ncbi:MAG: pyrroline-5-carboxylate reductase [Acidobacteria bacterium]|nr:pyrroline-5-carboxylate reductase [Acidobacteriota bacterium]